jgi:hypothetical protein
MHSEWSACDPAMTFGNLSVFSLVTDFIIGTRGKRSRLSGVSEMSEQAHSDLEEYKEARKYYDEFKRLRKQLGKPPREFIDPEGVKKDLTGKEFYDFIEELKKKKPV